MHDHFQEGDSGNAHVLEMVWVFAPGLVLDRLSIRSRWETIESIALGVDKLDEVFDF